MATVRSDWMLGELDLPERDNECSTHGILILQIDSNASNQCILVRQFIHRLFTAKTTLAESCVRNRWCKPHLKCNLWSLDASMSPCVDYDVARKPITSSRQFDKTSIVRGQNGRSVKWLTNKRFNEKTSTNEKVMKGCWLWSVWWMVWFC